MEPSHSIYKCISPYIFIDLKLNFFFISLRTLKECKSVEFTNRIRSPL